MNNHHHISILIERFFDGQTTRDEERCLCAYFASDDVTDEHMLLREMFLDIATLSAEDTGINDILYTAADTKTVTLTSTAPTRQPSTLIRLRRMWSAAATLIAAIVFTGGISMQTHAREVAMLEAQFGGSYVIVNGQRCDNLAQIKDDIKKEVHYSDSINLTIEKQETAQDIVIELLDDFNGTDDMQAIEDALNTIP